MDMKEILLNNEQLEVYPSTAYMTFCSVCCQLAYELEESLHRN